MATESDGSTPHGLPASWRQRLQDLDLLLSVAWKVIKVGGALLLLVTGYVAL